ncbi:rhodanese-related sulfurtransferase [Polaromonas sp. CF318]|uniref:rhodanese-like domain-containing protein n=1 Tax=Polaromonas sp. CF318 TaxID=1144318 RepID=UPI000270F24F|nr:rhodanese-like domain-containing protein [Polaromonas sp. CF318]EJL82488.1 rhodanese-related sulfurtransferase [Polaromonas sp. CF318]
MTRFVDAATLKAWLHDGEEIALFDVREHGQYGQSHLFYGITLPYSRLELDAPRLAPRKGVRLVVYDEDGASAAPLAARRLAAIGYSNVQVLQGGTAGWQAAGFALFAGVNVPSKTFGELAEQVYHTPRVSATELAAMIERKDDVVVLDGRPFSEFRKMNIPTAISCPNGELALRIRDLVPSESTHIVINCAGRTRSIIGAQTLINLGVRNPVSALENGTQGWYLADLKLEHGGTRRYPESAQPAGTADMRAAAQALGQRFGVPVVDAQTVRGWAGDKQRTLFLCDVRSPEEFAQGSLPGAQHTPGGQLIQATDQYVGVRKARLVLFDTDGMRALTVASWLRQLGHDASVLGQGLASGLALPAAAPVALPALPATSAQALMDGLADGSICAVDLRPSMQFRQKHIAGTRWSIRPRLTQALAGEHRPVVLIADEPAVAACAAVDLQALGLKPSLLEGGLDGWRAAGLPLQASENIPADSDCIDYLFFVHDRHDGNKEAARQYLAWEVNLIGQLDAQELKAYQLPEAAAAHTHA